MKISSFTLNKLDDFVAAKEKEVKGNPFLRTPFGMSREGNQISAWQMNFNRLGLFNISFGKNLFGKNEMILINVPATETNVHPLAPDLPFGWDGKINEYIAEMAVWWAFELLSDQESDNFMKLHKPVVEFSFFDSDGPGDIIVKFNGQFWEITG